jgi:hypothetical protein
MTMRHEWVKTPSRLFCPRCNTLVSVWRLSKMTAAQGERVLWGPCPAKARVLEGWADDA